MEGPKTVEPALSQSLNGLGSTVLRLQERMKTLETKLEPAMIPAEAANFNKTPTEGGPKAVRSPIVTAIDNYQKQIYEVCENLEVIFQRLEI